MGELLGSEVQEVKSPSFESYRDIYPEKKMTCKELSEAVNSEFNKAAKEMQEISGQKVYFDDNGNKYREGDNLLSNLEFEINKYKYRTDGQGRVISVEGRLQEKDHDGRNEMDSRDVVDKGDMKETDDRGHLIADRFNGSGGLENLVPMDAYLNRHGDYMKLENTLEDARRNGAKVELKVEPIYDTDSTRPSCFRISYTIGGDKEMVVFQNESEVKS